MISLHYTSHTKAYNTISAACNIVEAIYSFTMFLCIFSFFILLFYFLLGLDNMGFYCLMQIKIDWLIVRHCDYGPTLHRFWDTATY